MKQNTDVGRCLLYAFVIRVVIVFLSYYCIDNFVSHYFQWYYTDIDYFVYSDAAMESSPYERVTYRYPPLLSVLMIPNHVLHPCFGKILFSLFDSLIIYEIYKIRKALTWAFSCCGDDKVNKKMMNWDYEKDNKRGKDAQEEKHKAVDLFSCWIWCVNPISIYITTRGSCDCISNYFLLLSIRLFIEFISVSASVSSHLKSKRSSFTLLITLGIVFGFLVWFRLYPVIYFPVFVLFLASSSRFLSSDVNVSFHQSLLFVLAVFVTFSTLFLISWLKYGLPYVEESLLYHLVRHDHRHNFSSFFYLFYLEKSIALSNLSSSSSLGVVWKFIPILISFQTFFIFFLLIVYFLRLSQDLSSFFSHFLYCLFLVTVIFIVFNKVITGQYFLWGFVFLPLFLENPSSLSTSSSSNVSSLLKWSVGSVFFLFLWLFTAFHLELQGESQFWKLWMISCGFLLCNVVLVHNLISRSR
jgi:phosphatidylinositol glycan class M